MQTSAIPSKQTKQFPPFNLEKLLKTVFDPKEGEKLCILIDLDNPKDIIDFQFMKDPQKKVQKKAYEIFYQGILQGLMEKFGLQACDIFAYQTTGGSNLELPDTAFTPDGANVRFRKDIYPIYDIILCIGNYSGTAPLTATAKKFGFRGGTLHGLNDTILETGLAVDYNEVSRKTENLRQGLTHADHAEIDFELKGKPYKLQVDLARQDAQKSHGICRIGPDIVNLPAGEVYFVPKDAHGVFPIKFEEDGTLAEMHVEQGKVNKIVLVEGSSEIVKKYQDKFTFDPASSLLGELGFGTQDIPFARADIQDEKIFGTFHLATGRNDHLKGTVTLDRFKNPRNATHDDILFSSTKTPEIKVKQVRMRRNGDTLILIENYEPSPYLWNLYNK